MSDIIPIYRVNASKIIWQGWRIVMCVQWHPMLPLMLYFCKPNLVWSSRVKMYSYAPETILPRSFQPLAENCLLGIFSGMGNWSGFFCHRPLTAHSINSNDAPGNKSATEAVLESRWFHWTCHPLSLFARTKRQLQAQALSMWTPGKGLHSGRRTDEGSCHQWRFPCPPRVVARLSSHWRKHCCSCWESRRAKTRAKVSWEGMPLGKARNCLSHSCLACPNVSIACQLSAPLITASRMAIATISLWLVVFPAFDSGVFKLAKVLKDTGFQGQAHNWRRGKGD